jgi:hypothetical protein
MTAVAADQDVMDFSKHRSVRFKIDHADGTPDFFDGVPGLPALVLAEFAETADKLGTDLSVKDQVQTFKDLFGLVLTDESAERFINRLSDRTDPIGFDQVNEILPWIMEKYGMRPTSPSAPSSAGSESPDGSLNSMADAPPQVSTSAPSPQTVS